MYSHPTYIRIKLLGTLGSYLIICSQHTGFLIFSVQSIFYNNFGPKDYYCILPVPPEHKAHFIQQLTQIYNVIKSSGDCGFDKM